MAVPKKKTSKSRRDLRRTHIKLRNAPIMVCSNCKNYKRPHHICVSCGYYKDREVVVMENLIAKKG